MIMFICFVIFLVSTTNVHGSCFSNSTYPNTTTQHPCLVNGAAFVPNQLPPGVYPQQPLSPFYPPHGYQQQHQGQYGYRTGPEFQQQQPHGSNVVFPPPSGSGYQTAYNPYYRPNDLTRIGYSYPAGYRGPQTEWNHYDHYTPQYNNHVGQPPPRYTLGQGHPNLSPVSPLFQRRTYVSDYRQAQSMEPIFMDRGTVAFTGRDAELSCTFYDNRYRIVSVSRQYINNLTSPATRSNMNPENQNVAWVKVTGPYEYGSLHPPFECLRAGCNYIYLNSYNDFRFRVMTLGQTSTLRIYDYTPADQGIYRCAATAQGPDGRTVTIYKIIEFFSNMMMQQRPPFAGR